MGWLQGMRLGVLAIVVLFVLTTGFARAEDDRLKQAAALLDAASEDWRQEHYADAAEKLKQAERIYASLPKAPTGMYASAIRALVWNECLAGQIDECGATFERLIELLKDEPDYQFELDNAFSAIFKAARTKAEFAEAEAFLARARYAAKNADLAKLAAQITHSTASIASGKGEYETAVSYLEDAIEQRDAIGDLVGLAWSLNNLANKQLVHMGDLPAGLKTIVEAHAIVHGENVIEAQGAIAWNVRKALELAFESEEDLDVIQKGIETLIADAEASNVCEVISLPWLYRERLALAVKDGDETMIQKVAALLTRARLAGHPPEERADLVVTAVEAMIEAGEPSKAKSWLAEVECGDGPAAAHVTARLETARAILAAEAKEKSAFVEHANSAAARWKELGDWQGEREGLLALIDAAAEHEYTGEIAEVTARWTSIRGSGSPGGAGGSASSSGNRDGFKDLKPSATLFEITFEDGKIVLRDKVTEREQSYAVRWKPRNVGVNGLALKLFGGYIVVESLNYGGGAVSSGSSGSVRLADLGEYLPVPGSGALIIQKNGAVRYTLP